MFLQLWLLKNWSRKNDHWDSGVQLIEIITTFGKRFNLLWNENAFLDVLQFPKFASFLETLIILFLKYYYQQFNNRKNQNWEEGELSCKSKQQYLCVGLDCGNRTAELALQQYTMRSPQKNHVKNHLGTDVACLQSLWASVARGKRHTRTVQRLKKT